MFSLLQFVGSPAPIPPWADFPFQSKELTKGHKGEFGCEIHSGEMYLAACYAKMDESFEDLNKTERCIVCLPKTEGQCGVYPTIPAKPDWSVSLHHIDSCTHSIITRITIDRVTKEDEGKLICTYDYTERYGFQTNYTTVTVTVKEPRGDHLDIKEGVLYIAVPVVVVLLSLGLVIALAFAVRRRRRRRLTRRSRDARRSSCKYVCVCMYMRAYV